MRILCQQLYKTQPIQGHGVFRPLGLLGQLFYIKGVQKVLETKFEEFFLSNYKFFSCNFSDPRPDLDPAASYIFSALTYKLSLPNGLDPDFGISKMLHILFKVNHA
jgi:hypothetical protein